MEESKSEKIQAIKAVVNSSSSFEEKKAAVKEIMKYGQVPILHVPHRGSLKPVPDPGLRTLIENATTENEVKNLLKKGTLDYAKASQKTIKRWNKAANKRLAELKK